MRRILRSKGVDYDTLLVMHLLRTGRLLRREWADGRSTAFAVGNHSFLCLPGMELRGVQGHLKATG